jgi:enterochelin esterase-like enzyme
MPSENHVLARRTLLRGALTLGAGAAVSALLAACTPGGSISSDARPTPQGTTTRTPSSGAAPTNQLPQELAVIPPGYNSPANQKGTLVELDYDTWESVTYEQQTQRLTKRAIVYLPYGYDENQRYNVFYLMHGGWSNETTTLGTPASPAAFTNVLDNAIATGEIEPLIVVCPTYNNTSPDDSASFTLALELNQNYYRELLGDLLPAVEGRYSTYAENVSPEALMNSRDHRGFGGFSMGAVATWRTFQHGLDYFRYYLPMSCGTSLDMDNVLARAEDRDGSDYFVWIITGTDDFAHPFDEDRADILRNSRTFTEATDDEDGNFAFHVKDGYAHDGVAASEYTYNGLRWFWKS